MIRINAIFAARLTWRMTCALGVQLSETQLQQSMLAASTEEQAAPLSNVIDQPAANNEKVRSWDHSSAR